MRPAAARRRARRRELLIEIVARLFGVKGYEASIPEVAERAGIARGSLYNYIDSKESLLFDMLDRSHQDGLIYHAGGVRFCDDLRRQCSTASGAGCRPAPAL
jgi:AcrR family transcriptional regulator